MKYSKTVDMKVNAYFNAAGEHVCAIDFRDGQVCQFYRTKSFGTREVCAAADQRQLLFRGTEEDGTRAGFLIPGKWCPVKSALGQDRELSTLRRALDAIHTYKDYEDYADSVEEVVRTAKQWAGSGLPEPLSVEEAELLQAVVDLDG